MRNIKFGYALQIGAVVAIILLAGGHQLPKYATRLIFLAILAAIDMIYWLSVQKSFTRKYFNFFRILYWIPLAMLLGFFTIGIFFPFSGWPSFFRVYFPGVLLVLLIGKGIFLTMLFLGDLFIIPLNMIMRVDPEEEGRVSGWYRPRSFVQTSGTVAGVVILLYLSGMIFWVNNFKLHTVEIPVKNLPASFDKYKIVQISDLHLGTFVSETTMNKIVKLVNSQQPDVILFTGDLVNFKTEEATPFSKQMQEFHAADGKFAVLGNHDYGEYSQWDSQLEMDNNNEALATFYKQTGWHLLKNQHAYVKRNADSILIAGVENWSSNKRFGKKGDMKLTLTGADTSKTTILLSHDPSHWDGEINTSYQFVDLMLSGHTHAFQFAIELGSIKWSPASFLFDEWAGLYEEVHQNGVKQFLYVNRGAGTLGYPGRIATRPEVTLLILRRVN